MKSALKYELMSPLYEPLRARTLFFGKFLKMYEAWLYSLNRAIQSWWCARQDLNLHACAMEPKSIVSANSTTGADISGRGACRYFVVL